MLLNHFVCVLACNIGDCEALFGAYIEVSFFGKAKCMHLKARNQHLVSPF